VSPAAEFSLERDEIVAAAVDILTEDGFDAVSMRSVAARLGVSPVPLYSRVGNKEALLDAVAEQLFSTVAPSAVEDEPWPDYARRWATGLRSCLRAAPDSRLVLRGRRWVFVESTRPLIEVLRRAGMSADEAVAACRMLTWATVGFVAIEKEATGPRSGPVGRAAGGDPEGVDPAEADEMFDRQIGYLLAGIAAEHPADRLRPDG
jgi:TetR/AcrR family tetracycline transcriptional repressor